MSTIYKNIQKTWGDWSVVERRYTNQCLIPCHSLSRVVPATLQHVRAQQERQLWIENDSMQSQEDRKYNISIWAVVVVKEFVVRFDKNSWSLSTFLIILFCGLLWIIDVYLLSSFLFNLSFYCIPVVFVLYCVVLCCMPATALEKKGGGGKLYIFNKVKVNKKLRGRQYH